MISSRTLLAGAVFMLIGSAVSVSAQAPRGGFFPGAQQRTEAEALKQSIVNTIFPVAVGYGAVALFDNNTVETMGAATAVYGLIAGPSTGNLYANDYLRGGLGMLTRIGAVLLLQDATSEIFGREFADALNTDNKSISFRDTHFLIGSSLMIGSMAFNIITAPLSVREYNRSAMGYALEMHPLPGTGLQAPVVTATYQF